MIDKFELECSPVEYKGVHGKYFEQISRQSAMYFVCFCESGIHIKAQEAST